MGAAHSSLAAAPQPEPAPSTTFDEEAEPAHEPHVPHHYHARLRPGGPFKSRTLFGKQHVLHLAVQHNDVESLRHLLDYLRSWTSRQSAADALDAAKSLVNAFDSHQMTPLLLACQQGASEASRLLLDHGADPLLADRAGNNSMHLAARNCHVACIQELLSWEASQNQVARSRLANSRNGCGYAPLHYLVWHRCREGAELVLAAGASLTARNTLQGWDRIAAGTGNTPLHLAAHRGSTTMAKALLAAYLSRGDRARRVPDPRLLPDSDGRVPFEVALLRDRVQVLPVLNPATEWQEIFGEGAEVAHLFSPATLAEMAAAQLRWKLLGELEQIESAGASPSPAPLARTLSIPLRRHPSGSVRTPQDDPCCASTTPPTTPDSHSSLGPQGPFASRASFSKPQAAPSNIDRRTPLRCKGPSCSSSLSASPFAPLAGMPLQREAEASASSSCCSSCSEAAGYADDGASDAYEEMCGICLEAGEQLVHLQACQHFTCVACMKQLLASLKLGAPPVCPFCRGYIAALESHR